MNKYAELHQQINFEFKDRFLEISNLSSFEVKPNPDKWSKNEILGHLIDSAYNNHRRFLLAEAQGDLIFQGYDQDYWVIKNDYQTRDTELIFDLCFLSNCHLYDLLATTPLDVLEKETTEHNFHQICMNRIPEGQPSSLAYLAWDYCFHLEHHISQIMADYPRLCSSFEEF